MQLGTSVNQKMKVMKLYKFNDTLDKSAEEQYRIEGDFVMEKFMENCVAYPLWLELMIDGDDYDGTFLKRFTKKMLS